MVDVIGIIAIAGIFTAIYYPMFSCQLNLTCSTCKRSAMFVLKWRERKNEGRVKVASEQGWTTENYRLFHNSEKNGYKATCPHCSEVHK